jgi:hypothetical protein
VVYDTDKETGVSNIRDIKEQEIYFGTIPLMTAKGPLSSTVPSVWWSASCIVPPAFF